MSKRFLVAGLVLASAAGLAHASSYTFNTIDFPNSGTNADAGTNINGIANNGTVVGFSINNAGNNVNYSRTAGGTVTPINLNDPNGMALGIDSAGDVVGQQNGAAFFQPAGGSPQALTTPSSAAAAFGINDQGNIVGQYSLGFTSPGFYLSNSSSSSFVQIDAPSGFNLVNAQGVNDNGLVAGFYVGTDGQYHGFDANIQNASNGVLTGTALADPSIPAVAGEPGATFVFSQILGINDNGIAVGYYGDSTTSQHGFLYNTATGVYTFLDDPSAQFNNGVEVTQITGITNSGEIAGFYSDANGTFHGFTACPTGQSCSSTSPVPEPGSWVLASFGLCLVGLRFFRRPRAILAEPPSPSADAALFRTEHQPER